MTAQEWYLFQGIIGFVVACIAVGIIAYAYDKGRKTCEACRKRVPIKATKCQHCGSDLTAAVAKR